jgi:Domain of unknown function (DUF4440)
MAKMLDPEVIFFNETGEKATRADMAGATPPAAGAPIRTITTTDWDCKVYGDVAVTSFIDALEQGHLSEMKFRSVETWRKEGVAWKMIGSETLTLQQDLDGGAETAQTAQGRDVFFTPGRRLRSFSAAMTGRSPASFICAARTALCSSASSN